MVVAGVVVPRTDSFSPALVVQQRRASEVSQSDCSRGQGHTGQSSGLQPSSVCHWLTFLRFCALSNQQNNRKFEIKINMHSNLGNFVTCIASIIVLSGSKRCQQLSRVLSPPGAPQVQLSAEWVSQSASVHGGHQGHRWVHRHQFTG